MLGMVPDALKDDRHVLGLKICFERKVPGQEHLLERHIYTDGFSPIDINA